MKIELFLIVLALSIILKCSIEFEGNPFFSILNEKNHYGVKIGDINGDGLLDLIFAGYGEKLEVYLNSQFGIFNIPSYSSIENQSSFEIALGDIDRNGFLDVIVSNFDDPLRIYFNYNGELETKASFETNYYSLTSVSVFNKTNDGYLDIVVAGHYVPIRIFENLNGIPSTNPTWQSNETDLSIVSIKTGDIDKDGFQDIVVASDGGPLRVYKNNEGNFSNYSWQSAIYLDAQNLFLVDINSDGFLDVIVSQWNNSYVIFKNINGNFESYPSYYSFNSGFYESITAGDLDGDGFCEIFLSNDSFKVEGYDNINGNISSIPDYESTDSAHNWGISLGDLNSDGRLDFCVARRFQKSSCYKNIANFSDLKPSKPNLNIETMGQNVTFSVDSNDDKTPKIALSYFLRIGTGSFLNDVLYAPNSLSDFTPIYGDFKLNEINLSFEDGKYYASAQAVDLSYKRSDWSDEVNFIIDITPPSSQFTYPLNNENIITCGQINVLGISSDNVSGVEKTEFSYDGINYFLTNGIESWEYLWNVPSSGVYNLYSKATDKKSNTENPPNMITVQVTIDVVPPEDVSNSLFAYKLSQNSINFNWADRSSSGAVGYNIYKGFTANFMYLNPSPYDASNTNSCNDPNAIENTIFYNVRAFDLCGNESGDWLCLVFFLFW